MKTFVKSILVIVVVITSSIFANAQASGSTKQKNEAREFHPQRAMQGQRANQHKRPDFEFFTNEQKEKMKALKMEQFQATKPLKAQMKVLHAQKEALLAANQVDLSAVNSVIDDISELNGEMAKLQVNFRLSMSELLTTEQKMQLEMRKKQGNQNGKMSRKNKGNNLPRQHGR